MKNKILGTIGLLLVATLFAGRAHAAVTENGIILSNGLSSENGIILSNGLSSENGIILSNGLSKVNGLPSSPELRAARASIWTSNGIDPSRPLSSATTQK